MIDNMISRMIMMLFAFTLVFAGDHAICLSNDEQLTADGQYLFLVNDGEITILTYYGHEAIVSIPEQINGIPVTKIGKDAFSYLDTIWRVIVPENVNEIQDEAFEGSSLKDIILPESLTTIGDSVFAESDICSVYIPKSVTNIGRACFYECSYLSAVYVEGSIKTIPEYCFFECVNLKTVYLDNDIHEILENAFYFCIQLSEINVPDHLIFVDAGNFGNSKVFHQFSDYMPWDQWDEE